MADILALFNGTLKSTLVDILPIVIVMVFFQLLVLRQRIPHLGKMMRGFACVLLGLVFFLMGLEQALFPIGRAMAEQLTATEFVGGMADAVMPWYSYYVIYLFAFSIGVSTVMMEPAVIAITTRAEQLSGGSIRADGLRIAIAVGVGVGITLGIVRIITGASLHTFLFGAYLLVFLQTLTAPRHMIPLAYDSGGVSTSTVTVPIVAALGLGLATTLPGRDPLIDGFGMVAFAVIFPVIAVLAYAQAASWWDRDRNRGKINAS